MARGINKVILIGNLGRDPELRYLPDGRGVCNLNMATSESWKDRETGQPVERTEWHRVVMFGKLAEIASQYLRKGSHAYIEGKLKTRKWQDQEGKDRYTTEIVADQLQMLDSRQDGASGDYQQNASRQKSYQPQQQASQQASQQAPQQAPQNQQQAPQQTPQNQQQPAPAGFDDFDDDIPF